MAASYPTSAKSFSTKSTTDVVEASHVNDLQDEVAALETALLTGGLAHNLFPTGTRTLGTSSAFWDKGYVTALILGAETTSGVRVEVNAGSMDVREGDDSAAAPMSASALTLSGDGITLSGADPSAGLTASGASGANLRLRANGSMVLQVDLDNGGSENWLFRNGAGNDVVKVDETGAFYLTDGIAAPSTAAGFASIYVDTADGDLKVKFGDGTVKTLATDT